jgi:hypothetical protein
MRSATPFPINVTTREATEALIAVARRWLIIASISGAPVAFPRACCITPASSSRSRAVSTRSSRVSDSIRVSSSFETSSAMCQLLRDTKMSGRLRGGTERWNCFDDACRQYRDAAGAAQLYLAGTAG